MGTMVWIIVAGFDALRRRAGFQFSARRFTLSHSFFWAGLGHADRDVRLLGLLQRLLSGR